MRLNRSIGATLMAFALLLHTCVCGAESEHKTRHVIFVMTDGLRWQEVFRGAELDIMNEKRGGVADVSALKRAYWRETPEASREALLPFLWTVVARQGQIYGNRDKQSDAFVTNGKFFSYPGYNETLCGVPDPRIDSNGEVLNPNVTVLEWLNRKPDFNGKVAAFGAWYLFPWIFNAPRAGFPVNAGWDTFTAMEPTPALTLLNQLKRETPHVWEDEVFDVLTFHTALEYLKQKKPAVLYISFGETDSWAHARDYRNYLDAAHRVDGYLRVLWETIQSMPEYRDTTTLIFSPDHGRGNGPSRWTNHGGDTPESKYIWLSVMGPDTKALGERAHVDPVGQNQIAATLAALLGQDYLAEVPEAGTPVADILADLSSQ